MTVSFPYANLKGVSPVGILIVILYAQRMLGNLSNHILFAPSRRVLMIFSKDWFTTSTFPLACGWEGKE